MRHRRQLVHHVVPTILILLLAVAAVIAQEGTSGNAPDSTKAAMGRQSFRSYCATCHGPEGRGDGPVAEHLVDKPADLTQLSRNNGGEFPFEEVVKTIDGRDTKRAHGNPDMPVWGDAFKQTRDDPDEAAVQQKIEELAHFLQSIQE
jgi:mono/diheme cytochrome c family protein